MTDIVEREVKSNRAWREECEALRQQLAALNQPVPLSEWQKMEQQLAECQAREKVLRDALALASDAWGQPAFPSVIVNKALAMPSDLAALDTMLKAAKREALLEAADRLESYDYIKSQPAIPYAEAHELRRMAKELE